MCSTRDRKSTRLNSSHTEIYTLSLHDALPISIDLVVSQVQFRKGRVEHIRVVRTDPVFNHMDVLDARSEEHTSELQSHRDLHSFPTRRSSDLNRPGSQPGSVPKGTRRAHPSSSN